jgi:hypothetical protein
MNLKYYMILMQLSKIMLGRWRSKCQERKYGILLIGLAHRYFLPVSIHDLDIH